MAERLSDVAARLAGLRDLLRKEGFSRRETIELLKAALQGGMFG